MTCDQAIELLPWHLNGTLEAGETAEVRQHLETCERCRAALAETRQAWSVFAQHIPSSWVWRRLSRKSSEPIPVEDREAMTRHLAEETATLVRARVAVLG